MHALLKADVAVPLGAILLIQSTLTMAAYGIPVVIPLAAEDLGIEPESVGFLVAGVYLVAMVCGLASGVFVARLGPTRLFQVLLVAGALGVAALASAAPLVALAAIALAAPASYAPSNLGWSYGGRVYPVNPRYEQVAGLPCYRDLASIPEPVDCVAFALRDDRLPEAMAQAAKAKTKRSSGNRVPYPPAASMAAWRTAGSPWW